MIDSPVHIIDTHSHLLPWVDHGCPDLDTALAMARAAVESGIRLIVFTPHLPEWDPAKVRQIRVVAEQVRTALTDNGIDVYTLLGFEVDLSVAVGADPGLLKELTIELSHKVILFEMPYRDWPLHIEDTLFRLSSAGFTPVLAHPERNEHVQRSSEVLERCVGAGAVVQATAGSLTGAFGNTAVKTFFRLLDEGLVSMVATDAHAFRQENWTMAPVEDALEGRISDEDWRRLTYTNPLAVLQGRPPERVGPLIGGAGAAGGQKAAWLKKRLGRG